MNEKQITDLIERMRELGHIYSYQGAEIKGKVVHKEKIGDMHTITVQNYGIFVVTQTSYESLRIGDEVRL